MSVPESSPALPASKLYQTNFYAWTQEQAALLLNQQWHQLDLVNLHVILREIFLGDRIDLFSVRNRRTNGLWRDYENGFKLKLTLTPMAS